VNVSVTHGTVGGGLGAFGAREPVDAAVLVAGAVVVAVRAGEFDGLRMGYPVISVTTGTSQRGVGCVFEFLDLVMAGGAINGLLPEESRRKSGGPKQEA
jgi:hypothetical protein